MKIKECLDYKDGKLYWKVKTGKKVVVGSRAGSGGKNNSYRYIRINNKSYREHTAVWIWHYGNKPSKEIDHINGNKSDNRIENLREVTSQENSRNISVPKHNTSGFIGVQKDNKYDKWIAVIEVSGKRKRLGFYDDLFEAVSARLFAESYYGFHPNNGRTS